MFAITAIPTLGGWDARPGMASFGEWEALKGKHGCLHNVKIDALQVSVVDAKATTSQIAEWKPLNLENQKLSSIRPHPPETFPDLYPSRQIYRHAVKTSFTHISSGRSFAGPYCSRSRPDLRSCSDRERQGTGCRLRPRWHVCHCPRMFIPKPQSRFSPSN
jgi:hypothetical protein